VCAFGIVVLGRRHQLQMLAVADVIVVVVVSSLGTVLTLFSRYWPTEYLRHDLDFASFLPPFLPYSWTHDQLAVN